MNFQKDPNLLVDVGTLLVAKLVALLDKSMTMRTFLAMTVKVVRSENSRSNSPTNPPDTLYGKEGKTSWMKLGFKTLLSTRSLLGFSDGILVDSSKKKERKSWII
jgi:hypothetical protein